MSAVAASTALVGVVVASPAQAAPNRSCTANVGNSGLSAAVVAHSGQRIAYRAINATGCDIGIYVGQGVSHVRIDGVWVTGAGFQGIFAEKTSHISIEHSVVTDGGWKTIDPTAPPLAGNGLHSYVGQSFAISLFGVSHSTVRGNLVFNNGRGGIGVMDNGANDPGHLSMAPYQNPSAAPVDASYDSVVGNRTWANYNGCGLVAATQNFGGSLSHLMLADNTIAGQGLSMTKGADVGGLVVAADPPDSSVSNVSVRGNRVTNSVEGGVVVNAEAFNSFTKDVTVEGNRLSGNNWGAQEAPKTAGVVVFENPGWNAQPVPPQAKAPVNINTVITRNFITSQFYGIWATGNQAPKVRWNYIRVTAGGMPVSIG
ncbi:right-handed parallel beta-helix repeat-containing protein [Leekyejoonella antrihumi]|uniref:right-handed parallel beta-helix repeat-containing protein n=1 Tax=Leekyejoonella antrihumi TaxID=1660198 RepID=UPI0016488109|nr:right-handed parallel beta-helix repeat-containing protein [Leekyejoonella antrihumi]